MFSIVKQQGVGWVNFLILITGLGIKVRRGPYVAWAPPGSRIMARRRRARGDGAETIAFLLVVVMVVVVYPSCRPPKKSGISISLGDCMPPSHCLWTPPALNHPRPPPAGREVKQIYRRTFHPEPAPTMPCAGLPKFTTQTHFLLLHYRKHR